MSDQEDRITRAAGEDGTGTGGPKKSQATRIVELCADLDLWHVDQEPYAALMVDGHRETWPLRSRALRSLLSRRYYLTARSAAGRQAIEDALGGARRPRDPRGRLASRTYAGRRARRVDLRRPCDDRWRAIEIDAAGWRITANPPVNFIRRRGMLPLAEPVPGGSLDLLKNYLTVKGGGRSARGDWLAGADLPPDRSISGAHLWRRAGER